jgi:hypothetical protein
MKNLGIFYDHLVYFMSIGNILWYILWSFGTFIPVLEFCTKKNLATMFGRALVQLCFETKLRCLCTTPTVYVHTILTTGRLTKQQSPWNQNHYLQRESVGQQGAKNHHFIKSDPSLKSPWEAHLSLACQWLFLPALNFSCSQEMKKRETKSWKLKNENFAQLNNQ